VKVLLLLPSLSEASSIHYHTLTLPHSSSFSLDHLNNTTIFNFNPSLITSISSTKCGAEFFAHQVGILDVESCWQHLNGIRALKLILGEGEELYFEAKRRSRYDRYSHLYQC
jgi:hypothetical protein